MRKLSRGEIRAVVVTGALVAGLVSAGTAVGYADEQPVNEAFTAAAGEFDVPHDLVVAVGYGETHLDGHDGQPSQDNGFGVMHLVSNPKRHTLEQASTLTGESVTDLKKDTVANIRGGAAVLRAIADDSGLDATARDRLGAWYPVVARYSGASDERVAAMYADTVFEFLTDGVRASAQGEQVAVAGQPVRPERGTYADVQALDEGVGTRDYPDSIWNPASDANYASGRSQDIRAVVIHVTQGSYAGTISWFQNPDAQVSAHYVVRSEDGEITHMVNDADTAWHARDGNAYSIGIEHEGFVDDPSWFTDAMYRSSAALTKWLCDTYGIPKNRESIVGHSEVPGNDHTDPGPNWDWDLYMSYVNA